MAIELIQPAFTMQIKSIEEGSPAAATGKLKKGQIIESINGADAQGHRPAHPARQHHHRRRGHRRRASSSSVKDAEAAPRRWSSRSRCSAPTARPGRSNCPKSDKIVRDFADYLAKPGVRQGLRRHRHAVPAVHRRGQGPRRRARVGAWLAGSRTAYAWHLGYRRHPAVRILPAHRRPGGAAHHPEAGSITRSPGRIPRRLGRPRRRRRP